MTSPLDAVYEKYEHLDVCLSDPEWCTSGEGAPIYAIAGELWRALKADREVQQEITPSADIIADLERSLEFYKARMNNLQCWQSSMRDPERKIVCDILANGFTLTTKEEICQHSRIYSPVQMQQAIAQATEAENKRVLDDILRFVCVYESFLACDNENNEIYGVRSESIKNHLKSLRLAQPEPKERDLK